MATRNKTRIKQFGVKVQSGPGAATIDVPGSFSSNRSEGTFSYPVDEYTRNPDRASFTPLPSIAGSTLARCSFSDECVGGTITQRAPFFESLMGCGVVEATLSIFNLTSVTGNFFVGDLVGNNATQGSATKTGRVMIKTGTGSTAQVWILPVTGAAFATSEVLTNYSRSGGGTVSTVVNGGRVYTPFTGNNAAEEPMVTIEGRYGGDKHQMMNARGDVNLMLNRNQPLMGEFTFTGVPYGDTNGTPAAGAAIANTVITNIKPKIGKGIECRFNVNGTQKTGLITQIRIAMGNQVVGDGLLDDADVANSGYAQADIGGRRVVASVDPLYVASADFDMIGIMRRRDVFSFHFVIGSPSDPGGAVVVFAESVQITSDGSPGDRDGKLTQPLELLLSGSDDREIVIAHCFAAA